MEISAKTQRNIEITATILSIMGFFLTVWQFKRTREIQKAQLEYFKQNTR